MADYFKLKELNTNVKTEIIAGITTFLATMYIIVVNPAILSSTGMPFSGILTATVLVSAFSSIMMGIYANNPVVLAPGMGINAFFAYVVTSMKIPWETALGAVFWSGIIFLILSIFKIRTSILKSIPKQVRYGVAAGIGLFISFIGFRNANFIVANKDTLVTVSPMNPIIITFLIGLAITSILVCKKVKGSLILGIMLTTIFSIPIGRLYGDASAVNFGTSTLVTWKGLFATPDFSVFLKLDFAGSLKLGVVSVIFTFLFTDLFESIATLVGVSEASKLYDKNGEPKNIRQSLIVDALSTTMSGLFGTSAGTCYIESATGIEEGGRSGLTAVVAGLLFLPFMFFSPLLSIVPAIATAPALVLVGVFMAKPVLKINWSNFDDAVPAFLGIILIPFTYSITQGIIWGLLSWTILKLALGKTEEVSPMLIIVNILSIVSLYI